MCDGKPGSVTTSPSATASKSSAPPTTIPPTPGASTLRNQPRTALGVAGVLLLVGGVGGFLVLRRRR
jgi:hypothetical protein